MSIRSACARRSRWPASRSPKPSNLSESDPAAQALGYKADATKVDKAKFAKYLAGENCSNCQFFSGKAGDAYGCCAMFGTRQVAAAGWCGGYAKRA